MAWQSTGYWLYLGVLLTVTLGGAVALDHVLRRLVLTWYRLPGGLPRLKWVLTGTTAAVLALVLGLWLPLVALVAPISPTPIFSWAGWLGLCLVSQVMLLAAILVGIAQARFAGRCPKCGQREPGGYWPGRRCRACDSELWEGLWQ
jgi:type IV secretory pathway TrbD component